MTELIGADKPVAMNLTEEMKAFLVAAHQLAGEDGKASFNRDRVRLSLGISVPDEASMFDAFTAGRAPPLLKESRYPNATLTVEGQKRALQLMEGDPPLTRSQFGLLFGMSQLGPGGQLVKFADGYLAFLKSQGFILIDDGYSQTANAIGDLLSEHPYRYVDRASRKGQGSLTARGRARLRALNDEHKQNSDNHVARLHASSAQLQPKPATLDLPPREQLDTPQPSDSPDGHQPADPPRSVTAATSTPSTPDSPGSTLTEMRDDVRALRQLAETAWSETSPRAEPVDAPRVRGCWVRAYESFQRAIRAPGGPEPGPLERVWAWLRDHDPDDDYKLPDFENWSRYVRAHEQAVRGVKNTLRRGRRGRSIVSPDEI